MKIPVDRDGVIVGSRAEEIIDDLEAEIERLRTELDMARNHVSGEWKAATNLIAEQEDEIDRLRVAVQTSLEYFNFHGMTEHSSMCRAALRAKEG